MSRDFGNVNFRRGPQFRPNQGISEEFEEYRRPIFGQQDGRYMRNNSEFMFPRAPQAQMYQPYQRGNGGGAGWAVLAGAVGLFFGSGLLGKFLGLFHHKSAQAQISAQLPQTQQQQPDGAQRQKLDATQRQQYGGQQPAQLRQQQTAGADAKAKREAAVAEAEKLGITGIKPTDNLEFIQTKIEAAKAERVKSASQNAAAQQQQRGEGTPITNPDGSVDNIRNGKVYKRTFVAPDGHHDIYEGFDASGNWTGTKTVVNAQGDEITKFDHDENHVITDTLIFKNENRSIVYGNYKDGNPTKRIDVNPDGTQTISEPNGNGGWRISSTPAQPATQQGQVAQQAGQKPMGQILAITTMEGRLNAAGISTENGMTNLGIKVADIKSVDVDNTNSRHEIKTTVTTANTKYILHSKSGLSDSVAVILEEIDIHSPNTKNIYTNLQILSPSSHYYSQKEVITNGQPPVIYTKDFIESGWKPKQS